MQSKTIRILFAVSLFMLAGSGVSFLIGHQRALNNPQAEASALDAFISQPGDNWKYMGGALLLIGLASVFAAIRIWFQERKEAEPIIRIAGN
ncbi:MAG TPA: hypothetical protein VK619_06775 [Pyrinomonadaceae bacterium]|nr:hypothetical protein [Pyrinomonadaceae bacterium]